MECGEKPVISAIIGRMSDLRTPPNNVEVERAVLGSILLDTAGRSDDRVMDECRTRGIVPEAFRDSGATGEVKMNFIREWTRFHDREPEHTNVENFQSSEQIPEQAEFAPDPLS